jgi:hypothetical protein
LHIRGENGAQDRQTFAHFPVSASKPDLFCPIKLAGKHKYSVLSPVDYDPARAKQLRDSFFRNWKVHWKTFIRYVGTADIGDFIDVLKVADKAKVWCYRAIQEHEVVVVLMLISDFKPVLANRPTQPQATNPVDAPTLDTPPQPEPKPWRKNWIRFWFESRARDFEEFWNLPEVNKVIIRVEYAVPAGETKLKPDYLDSFKVVDVSFNYLAKRKPGDDDVAEYVEKRMKGAFKKYLQ